MRVCRKIKSTLLVVLIVILVGFIAFVSTFFAIGASNAKRSVASQAEFMANIDSYYEKNAIPAEQSFVSFDMQNMADIQLNDVSSLMTHNSYKTKLSPFSYGLVNLISKDLAHSINYAHDRLTEQLQNGVRGFELDLQYKDNEFSIEHIPMFDNIGSCPNFELAMQEIAEWSKRNPNHIPITVMFEVKALVPVLNMGCKDIDAEGWNLFDNILLNTFGEENIITPSFLMGDNCETLQQVATTDSAPLLEDCLGKVMFVLHPHETCTDTYIARDTTMQSQVMTPFINMGYDGKVMPEYEQYSLFRMLNQVKEDVFMDLTQQGYFLRTRMDADMIIDKNRESSAIASCAQFLTTDFEAGHLLTYTDYVASFEDGYTVTLRPNLSSI